jgi:diguanylate cyclase (GGDEF)-like protein
MTMMRSFRVKATLLFGALALFSLFLLSYMLGGMLTEQALRERGDALHDTAKGAATLFAEGLYERMREVNLLAQSNEARRIGLDASAWRAEIDRLREGRPYYAWIGVADAGGTVRSATHDMLVGADVSRRPWFVQARQGPYVGDVHQAKLLATVLPAAPNGEPLRFIDFAAPLHGASGETLGVIGVHADWRWAQEVIAMVRSQDGRDAGMLVYVFDRDRRVIHPPDGPEGRADLVTGASPPHAPSVQLWGDGNRYLTTAVPVPARSTLTDLGWTVVVRQPLDKALAPVAQAQRAVWLAGGLVAAAAMFLTWMLAGRFSRPLVAISEAAERIEAGQPEGEIPLSRRTSELERLSGSLDRMTRRLVTRERQLAEANNQLEARVAARTAELAAANRQLESMAHQDGLTRLYNRRAADMLLDKELAHHRRNERPLSVLLADIDHFKKINDTFGHATGDDVLRAVAHHLGQVLRLGDVAARFGGEEFLVILPETDGAGAAVVAEKLRASVASMRMHAVGSVTMSIGCAHVAAGAELRSGLLKRADDALYEAKAQGRNRVVVAASAAAAATA